MSKDYNISDFDFSGKRVRYLGKSLTKSRLSYIISQIDPWSVYGIYDCYPYVDYARSLKDLLSHGDQNLS